MRTLLFPEILAKSRVMALNLLDIIPLEDLQELQDTLAKVANVGAVVVDLEGKHITRPSRFSRFCAMMRGNELTLPNCRTSAMEIGSIARAEKRAAQKPCMNLGLSDASAPIVLNGEHVASWMIGQCVTRHLPDDEVRAFARANGFNEDEVLTAYNEIKVITPEAFNDAIKLLSLFTANLSQVCYKNYQIQQADMEKARIISMLDTILSSIEAGIYVCDPQSGELVYANHYLTSLLGRGELAGRTCAEALAGLAGGYSLCGGPDLCDEEGKPRRTPHRWEFHHAESGRDFMAHDLLITWHDGRLLQLSLHIDITERKALLAAEAANAAKRDFLAQMSHELRTPMTGVLGLTHLALKADPPQRQREYLQKIETSATLLLGVINDVLDFSKIEAGKLELSEQPFSLRDLLRSVRDMVQPRIQSKGLQLRLTIDQNIPDQLYGDSLRFSQVLMNLLGNAVKFTHQGFIQIRMDLAEETPHGVRLRCRVTDTGIGMTPEQAAKLFSPFTQANRNISGQYGGTGLGLSISKKLVELMGGTIAVASQAGRGSTFTFDLPLDLAANHAPAANGALPASLTEEDIRHALQGKKILLAEDNEINQEIALELLRGFGAEVDLAVDGQQAVNAAVQTAYDLILMDIQMPIMDGYEATRQIRAATPPNLAPIIAMTANAMKEDRDRCLAAGMNGYIAKPIDLAELKQVLAANI